MKTLFERILITNWKTSLCGGILAIIWITFLFGKMSETAFLALASPVIVTAMALAKDGIREDKPVAREDIKEE